MTDKYAKKSSLDKFYTKLKVADGLIDKVVNILGPKNYIQTIVEPSAGSGSFSYQFSQYLYIAEAKILAYDIEPTGKNIEKRDFLDGNIDAIVNGGRTVVIGNPPFGKQCSDAIKFFNKCASYNNIEYICFVLPPTFRKDSIIDKLDDSFELIKDIDVEDDSFILHEDGKERDHSISCIFQIWKRSGKKRAKSEKHKPNDLYSFSKCQEDAAISFRRIGVNAGKSFIINKDSKFSGESHIFICTELDPINIVDKLNDIKWPKKNTVGPRSISKNDLTRELNKITCEEYEEKSRDT